MKHFRRILKNQAGLTLIEMVIALILIGVIFPTIFSLAGFATVKATQLIRQQKAQYLAESKIEEIIGFKSLNWDWYKKIKTFEKTEKLADGFQRSVKIQELKNWGKGKINCWEVQVIVSHPNLKDNISLSIRLTKYYEEK